MWFPLCECLTAVMDFPWNSIIGLTLELDIIHRQMCNFGMRNWLRGIFSWFKQVGYIKMQKIWKSQYNLHSKSCKISSYIRIHQSVRFPWSLQSTIIAPLPSGMFLLWKVWTESVWKDWAMHQVPSIQGQGWSCEGTYLETDWASSPRTWSTSFTLHGARRGPVCERGEFPLVLSQVIQLEVHQSPAWYEPCHWYRAGS